MKNISSRLSALAVAGATLAMGAQASAADTMSREICRQVVPSVGKQYAGILQPIAREGHCLAGDFNGDGKPDALMVVKVLVGEVAPTTGIKTLPTFWEQTYEKGRLQFLALHSTASAAASAWDKYDRLLLDGSSPVLVLRREEMASDMLRVTPHSREVKELQVPRKDMHGDGMHLDTEAVSAILYWNGRKYVFHEDPAGP